MNWKVLPELPPIGVNVLVHIKGIKIPSVACIKGNIWMAKDNMKLVWPINEVVAWSYLSPPPWLDL